MINGYNSDKRMQRRQHGVPSSRMHAVECGSKLSQSEGTGFDYENVLRVRVAKGMDVD
jgi:hypothetical protein